MSALRSEIISYINIIPEYRLAAIKPLLVVLSGAEVERVTFDDLTEDERAELLNCIACLDINLHDIHGRNILTEALWL